MQQAAAGPVPLPVAKVPMGRQLEPDELLAAVLDALELEDDELDELDDELELLDELELELDEDDDEAVARPVVPLEPEPELAPEELVTRWMPVDPLWLDEPELPDDTVPEPEELAEEAEELLCPVEPEALCEPDEEDVLNVPVVLAWPVLDEVVVPVVVGPQPARIKKAARAALRRFMRFSQKGGRS